MPARTTYTFHPVTPERWPDLEQLFGERGACGGCWCMSWRRKTADFRQNKGSGNKRALKQIVCRDLRPGVLAYDGDKPVGWCSIAPREAYLRLESSRVLAPVDDQPVWAVSCLFVDKAYRRRGLSVELLRAAAAFAQERGALIVEGYPVVPYAKNMPAPFAWTGTLAAFERAGFLQVARRSQARPIMRFTCSSSAPTKKRLMRGK
jgi:GNAT superfamily N-acetyltransferase